MAHFPRHPIFNKFDDEIEALDDPPPLISAYVQVATGTYYISKLIQDFTDLIPEAVASCFDDIMASFLITGLDTAPVGRRAVQRMEYYKTMFDLCE